MRLAMAVVATMPIVLLAQNAHGNIGLLNTRLDTGIDWYLDNPANDDPVYPGFHVTLSADGRLVPRLHYIVESGFDAYRYGVPQRPSQLFSIRSGLMGIPVDFDGGHGFVEATAGYGWLHGGGGMVLSAGFGYMAQYGRLGIGLFSRYTQLLGQSDCAGHGVKALVFGVTAGMVMIEPRRPPPPPPAKPPDEDGDGVEDGKDKCPKTRKDAKVDDEGCEKKPVEPEEKKPPEPEKPEPEKPEPEEKPVVEQAPAEEPPAPEQPSDDVDQDGVLNPQDQCPNTTRGFPVNALSGCPELRRHFALPQVTFAPLTARIDKESYAQLDELFQLFQYRPRARLKITGYVKGTEKTPLRVIRRVSSDRAQVVRELIVARGLSPKRVRATGSKKPDLDEIEISVSGSTKLVLPRGMRPGARPPTPPPTPPNAANPSPTPPAPAAEAKGASAKPAEAKSAAKPPAAAAKSTKTKAASPPAASETKAAAKPATEAKTSTTKAPAKKE